MDLFDDNSRSAIFSPCGMYRYLLFRHWNREKPFVIFIGLNPSTATQSKDDPTIRRVKKLAADWGYGGVCMMNLFAFISPYPEDLKTCADAIGENNTYLRMACALGVDVIFSWGAFDVKDRASEVIKMFPRAKALIINKDGSPRHPLYVPGNVKPVNYNP
ncbi:DUF1643 domain-containing protein [Mucilaginibacter glaciei]|uniref:DUF1643 domain-containing protein n=1 Tax=Mucilaginibacter glaciei TaxID=2772109 RepID=A0A926NSM4_9SPHI|nr:DUF1643 domain-containing protein [Mucilaginibacter glaciei]MBD1394277.1 DUF1643 domain-containing protein [Mucilaginibacter glaciei]